MLYGVFDVFVVRKVVDVEYMCEDVFDVVIENGCMYVVWECGNGCGGWVVDVW